ncbi:hypothetical protein [Agromyces sp. SYSU T00194]|uniref:hypothetical protein n=1 Tax=Agromyces chitinivorans TaxID=3158560 RepID=UPI003393E95A
MAEEKSRLEELRWLVEVTRDSLAEAPADKRSPLIGQMRALLQEIEELGGRSDAAPAERTGLLDFQEALAKRQSEAAASRRPAR